MFCFVSGKRKQVRFYWEGLEVTWLLYSEEGIVVTAYIM
jgi:hypothetical protein